MSEQEAEQRRQELGKKMSEEQFTFSVYTLQLKDPALSYEFADYQRKEVRDRAKIAAIVIAVFTFTAMLVWLCTNEN